MRPFSGRTARRCAALLPLLLACCLFCVALCAPARAQSLKLSPLETRLLGQGRWLSGAQASLRVLVSDRRTGNPVSARVLIALQPVEAATPEMRVKVYSGSTTPQGTLEAKFLLPRLPVGAYTLIVNVESALGNDELREPMQIEDGSQLMLTCDKPLYQPGQTMHLRALALDLATMAALGNTPLTFEVEDARGNKVFKSRTLLSPFGISSADFTLADEVNMGVYTLRAVLPNSNTEKKVRVERYVLPKFNVVLGSDKRYYLPGETVKGYLQADYFFGKPVARGTVNLSISTIDIGVTELANMQGETDAEGRYDFEYILPDHFVGQAFEQGKGVVEFHARLTDSAEHVQEGRLNLPVVSAPMLLAMVPENRTLAPKLANRIFVAVATPDGSPLSGIRVSLSDAAQPNTVWTKTTDALGLALFNYTPKDAAPVTLRLRAEDRQGQSAVIEQSFSSSGGEDAILLRSDKSIVRVGDRINLAAISTRASGTIYLDVIRNKQTILTKAIGAVNGQAALALPITPEMTGTLEIHAYRILPNEEIIRDTQLVLVMPATDLSIAVTLNKPEYRPGEDATLTFKVTDSAQHPVLAALGIAVVDESVFALSELQPGLEKIYFMLEKELMETKYEIHGLTPVGLMLDPRPDDAPRQLAADMLFAAVPAQHDFSLRANSYQQRWKAIEAKAREAILIDAGAIADALRKYKEKTGEELTAKLSLYHLVNGGYLTRDALLDPWENFYRTDIAGAENYAGGVALPTPRPDTPWGTKEEIPHFINY